MIYFGWGSLFYQQIFIPTKCWSDEWLFTKLNWFLLLALSYRSLQITKETFINHDQTFKMCRASSDNFLRWQSEVLSRFILLHSDALVHLLLLIRLSIATDLFQCKLVILPHVVILLSSQNWGGTGYCPPLRIGISVPQIIEFGKMNRLWYNKCFVNFWEWKQKFLLNSGFLVSVFAFSWC